MREFKGSKGEWKYDSFTRAIGIVSRDDDQSYGMICDEIAHVEFIDGHKEICNARLISCAPDMVKLIAELMDEQGDKLKEQESWVYYRAKQILDKALGDE